MLILNADPTDNKSPARIFTFEKLSGMQTMFMLTICDLGWCATHQLPFMKTLPSLDSGYQWSEASNISDYKCLTLLKTSKAKHYDSQKHCDKARNKTKACIRNAFERCKWLKAETNLKWIIFSWTGSQFHIHTFKFLPLITLWNELYGIACCVFDSLQDITCSVVFERETFLKNIHLWWLVLNVNINNFLLNYYYSVFWHRLDRLFDRYSYISL